MPCIGASRVESYICDQLAMARLPRATFALLPASAAVIGFLVLHQVPTLTEIAGVALVVCGVAVHQEADAGPAQGGATARRVRGSRRTERRLPRLSGQDG